MAEQYVVTVFGDGPDGGNPAPVVLDAGGWTDAQMQAVAQRSGHESAFVDVGDERHAFGLRFWVPRHEMTMCGHATVGATWLMHHLGRVDAWQPLDVSTRSGTVRARLVDGGAEVSQPAGTVDLLEDAQVRSVVDALGVSLDDLDGPVVNARTSRTKTLVPLHEGCLDHLGPRPDAVEAACTAIDSTGLYPYELSTESSATVDARQFPRGSGYAEDPATGVAAAALAWGLAERGVVDTAGTVVVRQGRAMGRPSRITVRFDPAGAGCWVGGKVELTSTPTGG